MTRCSFSRIFDSRTAGIAFLLVVSISTSAGAQGPCLPGQPAFFLDSFGTSPPFQNRILRLNSAGDLTVVYETSAVNDFSISDFAIGQSGMIYLTGTANSSTNPSRYVRVIGHNGAVIHNYPVASGLTISHISGEEFFLVGSDNDVSQVVHLNGATGEAKVVLSWTEGPGDNLPASKLFPGPGGDLRMRSSASFPLSPPQDPYNRIGFYRQRRISPRGSMTIVERAQ